MSARTRVADIWDEVLASRHSDDGPRRATSRRVVRGRRGQGRCRPDAYPDPYVGNLRGETHDVRVVAAGRTPASAIRRCKVTTAPGRGGSARSATAVASSGARLRTWRRGGHCKASTYWRNLLGFPRRWLGDDDAGLGALLNLELYPWHSPRLTATPRPPADVVQRYVWDLDADVDAEVVFAFGKPWIDTCTGLGLEEVARWGPGGLPMPGEGAPGWLVVAYRLASGQVVVASSQPGYSGPPGPKRIAAFREMVAVARG